MTASRRNLAAVLIVAALHAGATAPAAARPGDPVGGVRVDVAELRQQGLGPLAERLRECLTRRLGAEFAHRKRAGSPMLVARMKGFMLNGNDIGGELSDDDSVGSDYLEGDVMLVGRNGAVIERQPILSALSVTSGGAWYVAGFEARRVEAICGHFAAWAKRMI